ncbi:DUF3592 domain-containing protein [Catellatospora bangladeshensis]|uniref:DUF3592 domain-containing protein n=1 Tax=Catellatospora bangladeshensis TaxID=310355 RepID=A0A8J3JK27_9ACTN|nr:DUF3592 domain-containing protein [Catellatospora bangladeshensis]GIF82148.1 hypothetical protein Cba03nite_34970 [Catellatospora bangladeshensis]
MGEAMALSSGTARSLRLVIIGSLFLAFAVGLYFYLDDVIEDRRDGGIQTVGTVVDRDDLRMSRAAKELRLTIRYLADVRTVEVKAMALNFGAPEIAVGEAIPLSYDRDAPERMATESGYASEDVVLILPRLMGVIGLCLLMVAMVNYLVSTR